jgi:hypothetical protein
MEGLEEAEGAKDIQETALGRALRPYSSQEGGSFVKEEQILLKQLDDIDEARMAGAKPVESIPHICLSGLIERGFLQKFQNQES